MTKRFSRTVTLGGRTVIVTSSPQEAETLGISRRVSNALDDLVLSQCVAFDRPDGQKQP
jgi:hypothetical protein